MTTFLVAYTAAMVILNTTITFTFTWDEDKPDGWPTWADELIEFLLFYPLWPAGLIVFFIKWLQGRASIGE